MKIFLTILLALFFAGVSYAQPLPGGVVYQINGIEAPPVQFAKISSAISYLSTNGVTGTGDVVFELGTLYNPSSEPLTGINIPNIAGTNSTRTVIFRPAVSVSKTISVSQNGGHAINFNGCSYVTIDGRQGGSGAIGLTLINLSFDHTPNTAVVKFSGDATYNLLNSCIVNGAALNDTSGNIYFTFTGSSTGNSFNKVTNCDIGGLGTKLPVNGILSIGKSIEVNNSDNIISNNQIHDFTVDIGKTHGVDVRAFCKNFTILNNSFYQTAPRVFSGNSKMDCINIDEPNLGVGFNINKNTIGGTAADGSGMMNLYSDFALDFNGIKLNVSGSGISNVDESTVKNVTLVNNPIFLSQFSGINIIDGKVEVGTTTANIIGSTVGTGSFDISSPHTPEIYNVFGIVSSSISQVKISKNKIGGFKLSGATGAINLIGIFSVNSSDVTITQNQIGNPTASNMQGGNNLDNSLYGIYCNFNANANISNNLIRNFELKNAIDDQANLFVGITNQVQSLSGTYTINHNDIFNFTISSAIHNYVFAGIREIALGSSSQNYTSDISYNNIHDFNTTAYTGLDIPTETADVSGILVTNSNPSQKRNGSISSNTIYNITNNCNVRHSETNGVFNNINADNQSMTGNLIYNLNATSHNNTNLNDIALTGITNNGSATYPNMQINENTIANLTLMGSDTSKTAGILCSGTSAIKRNVLYNIGNQINHFAAISAGIIACGAASTKILLSNNQITMGFNSTNNNAVYGILSNTTQDSLLIIYNSVVVSGTGAGADNSAGIYRRGFFNTTNMWIRNNIVMNNRTPGSANSLALTDDYDGSFHTGWGTDNSNYNTFINADPNMFCYYNNTFRSLADYKIQSESDYNSYYGQNTSGASDAHHLNPANLFTNYLIGNLAPTTNQEAWYVIGKSITGEEARYITEDYLTAGIRSGTLGYPSCIGAAVTTTSTQPFDCIGSAAIADGSIVDYDFGYRQISRFTFHALGGTVPSSLSFKYFSGVNPPSSYGRRTNSYFKVNATGGSGYSYDMVLLAATAEKGNIPDYLAGRGAYYNGSVWDFILNNAVIISPIYNVFQFDARTIPLNSSTIFALTDETDPLPVELASFYSTVERNNIKLNWSTASEINNKEFVVERKDASPEWIRVGVVNGSGTANTPKNYSFTNSNLTSGKYHYRLKQIDFNGNFKYYDLANEVSVGNPEKFSLSQNYPNPFNPATKINFEIKSAGLVSLKVYDMAGKEAATLVNEIKDAGFYTVSFDAGQYKLSSGTYFYRIETNGFADVKRMMLVK